MCVSRLVFNHSTTRCFQRATLIIRLKVLNVVFLQGVSAWQNMVELPSNWMKHRLQFLQIAHRSVFSLRNVKLKHDACMFLKGFRPSPGSVRCVRVGSNFSLIIFQVISILLGVQVKGECPNLGNDSLSSVCVS